MSLTKVQRAVEDSLASDTPEVLAIKGAWGIGKTFFWDKFVKSASQDPRYKFQHYAYVSLFGVSSLDELKFAIFERTVNRSQIGERISIDNLKQNATDLAKGLGRKASWLLQMITIPWLKNIGPLIHSAAFLTIKDMLICLDDFERKGDKLSAKDVLGIVSLLRNQMNCHVVMIFNDIKLDGEAQKEYKDLREKVIDVEVIFNPNPKEAAYLAFSDELKINKGISDLSIKLGISNIRILRKIERAVKSVEKLLREFEPKVLNQALKTLTLFGWGYYSNNEQFYEYVKSRHKSYVIKENKTIEQQEWDTLLNDYGFLYMDEFDLVLAKIIETGYVDEESLLEEAKKLNAQVIADKSQNSFGNAWELFHDTFAHNEDELVNALEKELKENAEYISPVNLNGAVSLIRDLGKYNLASELIDAYIQKNKSKPKIFDLDNYPFSGDIDDDELISKFNLTFNETKEIKTLEDVLLNISGKNSWGKSDEEVLQAASEDDFYQIFKTQEGQHLSSYVKTCLQIKASAEKAKNALFRIGRENNLNRIRVRRFGVSIKDNEKK
jgi:hypothetical protein